MIGAILLRELHLRARVTASAAAGLLLLTAAVGALFPTFRNSIGTVHLPTGVSTLLGGGNFGTITGWLNTEVVSVYGPLVVAGVATAHAAAFAGDDEAHVLALVLAHPVSRARLLLARAAALATSLLALATAILVGLLLAVTFAGGGIAVTHLVAVAVHLWALGLAVGAFALAIAATTGRRALTAGTTAAVVLVMFVVNGFAPAVTSVSWLKYLTVFYYYEGHDQLEQGLHPLGLAILLIAAVALTATGVLAFERRDLRG